MPNWCDFSVTFYGDEECLQKLDEAITVPEDEREEADEEDLFGRPDLDLTRPYPCPEELWNSPDLSSEGLSSATKNMWLEVGEPSFDGYTEEQKALHEKYGAASWWHWNVSNWGTKWAPDLSTYDPHGPNIFITGLSAWAPPSNLIAKLTGMFNVKAVLTYSEPSMAFGGSEAFVNGQKVYDGHFDFSEEPSIGHVPLPEGHDPVVWDDYHCRIQDAIEEAVVSREIEACRALASL